MITVTVIMSALNEQHIDKTIETLLTRSSEHLKEIIVIDDYSEIPVEFGIVKPTVKVDKKEVPVSYAVLPWWEWETREIENNPGNILPMPDIKIIRNSERQGLIRSRNIGAGAATSDIIVSMDPHIKVDHNWLPPIVERLSNNYKCIGIPLTRGLAISEWRESSEKDAKTFWRWDLDFYWGKDDGTDRAPAMAGHCFSFTKKWWEESGGLDDGMEKWGGENIEFPLRTWLCGGSVEVIRDSCTAHWFKTGFINYPMDSKSLMRNKARIVEVWFEEYKQYFYQTLRKKPGDIETGDISQMLDIKRRLQTKPMAWFVENLAPELGGILKWRNRYPNSNIAVLGSGPSLDHVNVEQLKCFDVVVGVNWNALVFDCDFVLFHDVKPAKDVLNSRKYESERLLVPDKLKDGSGKFAEHAADVSHDWTTYQLGSQDKANSLKNKWPPFFHHASTVHTAVHFAAFLGANRIMLFGCDTKFAPDGRSHTKLVPQYRNGRYWPKNKDSEQYLARIGRGYDMLRDKLRSWNVAFLRSDYL